MNQITPKFRRTDKKTADECWPWKFGKNPDIYGLMRIGKNKMVAHRVSFIIHNGAVPDSLLVLHKCDNPPCVNPNHLFAGTHQENMDDMVKKGRSAKGLKNGQHTKPEKTVVGSAHGKSKLTESDVREIRSLYAAGGIKQSELASRFGITPQNISDIVIFATWKHVQ